MGYLQNKFRAENYEIDSETEHHLNIQFDLERIRIRSSGKDGIVLKNAWAVVALGGLEWSQDWPSMPCIRILLEDRRGSREGNQFYLPTSNPVRITCLIPLPYIRNLTIGSILRNGVHVTTAEIGEPEYWAPLSFQIERQSIEIVKGEALPENIKLCVPLTQSNNFLNDQLFAIIHQPNNTPPIVISCVEIYRYFYGRSPFLSKYIFDGTILEAEGILWKTSLSNQNNLEDVSIEWLKECPSFWNIPFVASFAFCPEAKKEVDQIILWICANSALKQNILIRALPPVRGQISGRFRTYRPVSQIIPTIVKSIDFVSVTGTFFNSYLPFENINSIFKNNIHKITTESCPIGALNGKWGINKKIKLFADISKNNSNR